MAQQKGREIMLTVAVHLMVAFGAQEAPKACSRPIDVGFLIDASRNIGIKDFDTVKKALKGLLDRFEVKASRTHASIIWFSEDAKVALDFNGLTGEKITKENVAKFIDNISVTNEQARIDKALTMANSELFSTKRGMRTNAKKVLFVATNGKQKRELDFLDVERLLQASASLKAKGVHVYSIAVGDDYDLINLLTIANDEESVFRIGSDKQLSEFIEYIIKQICETKVDM